MRLPAFGFRRLLQGFGLLLPPFLLHLDQRENIAGFELIHFRWSQPQPRSTVLSPHQLEADLLPGNRVT